MLELVVEQGVYGTSMSQLSRKSGIASSTIYHYFNNKHAIIEELFYMVYQDFGTSALSNLPNEDSLEKQLKAMWRNLYNYFVINPLAFKFSELVEIPSIVNQESVNKVKKNLEPIKNILLEGIKAGELKDINVRLIMQLGYGHIVSAVRLHMKKELEMNEKNLKDAEDTLWDMIRKIN